MENIYFFGRNKAEQKKNNIELHQMYIIKVFLLLFRMIWRQFWMMKKMYDCDLWIWPAIGDFDTPERENIHQFLINFGFLSFKLCGWQQSIDSIDWLISKTKQNHSGNHKKNLNTANQWKTKIVLFFVFCFTWINFYSEIIKFFEEKKIQFCNQTTKRRKDSN